MEHLQVQPHILLEKGDIDPVVVVVGDPARALAFAKNCESFKELSKNREYHTYKCFNEGISFTVASHGVGSAGAAICFEELILIGAKIIIRVGTAGSLQPEKINMGDSVLCVAAAREDGISKLYAPPGLPAIADPYVTRTIYETAVASGFPLKEGITLTCDVFYKSPVVESCLPSYANANVDIVEMEMATLFVIARMRGVKAAGVCCIDGCALKWSAEDYAPRGEKLCSGINAVMNFMKMCVTKLAHEAKNY